METDNPLQRPLKGTAKRRSRLISVESFASVVVVFAVMQYLDYLCS